MEAQTMSQIHHKFPIIAILNLFVQKIAKILDNGLLDKIAK
jgi:hypothetical protein